MYIVTRQVKFILSIQNIEKRNCQRSVKLCNYSNTPQDFTKFSHKCLEVKDKKKSMYHWRKRLALSTMMEIARTHWK